MLIKKTHPHTHYTQTHHTHTYPHLHTPHPHTQTHPHTHHTQTHHTHTHPHTYTHTHTLKRNSPKDFGCSPHRQGLAALRFLCLVLKDNKSRIQNSKACRVQRVHLLLPTHCARYVHPLILYCSYLCTFLGYRSLPTLAEYKESIADLHSDEILPRVEW